MPSITSLGLCGGILVDIPTAIPVVPLINRFGRWLVKHWFISLLSKFGNSQLNHHQ